MQMNIQKIIYLNCWERYENMIDHRSFTSNLGSCEIKAWSFMLGQRKGGNICCTVSTQASYFIDIYLKFNCLLNLPNLTAVSI